MMFIVRRKAILQDGTEDYWLIGVFPFSSAHNLAFGIDEFYDISDCEFSHHEIGGISLNTGNNALFSTLQKLYDSEKDYEYPEFTLDSVSDTFGNMFDSSEPTLWYSLDEALKLDLDLVDMLDIECYMRHIGFVESEEIRPLLKVVK